VSVIFLKIWVGAGRRQTKFMLVMTVNKGKAILTHTWTGTEYSRRLVLPDFMTIST